MRIPFFKRLGFIFLVIIAVAVAWGLRLKAVQELPIDFDEDDYLGAAIDYRSAIKRGEISEIINYDYNLEHPPLSKLVYGFALLPLPDTEPLTKLPPSAPIVSSLPHPHFDVARWVSATLGTLEVFILALVNPIAGVLLGINTWQIKYTSQIMLEPLPALFSLLTVFAYYRSGRRKKIWLLISALSFGITMASKYPYGIVGIAIILDWLWESKPEEEFHDLYQVGRWLKPVLLWGIITIAVFFLFNPRMWADPFERLFSTVTFHFEYAQGEQVESAGLPFWQPLVWLSMPVPWHPGVFIFYFDFLITILAIIGFRQLWFKYRVFALWLGIALVFLIIWPTKWPQYILILTAPLSLSAAEGIRNIIASARNIKIKRSSVYIRGLFSRGSLSRAWQDSRRAIPWLLVGTIVLGLIALYPLLFQGAMSLTDFSAVAIRDGLSGGVWREVWRGATGQVEPVEIRLFNPSLSKQVHYAGSSLFLQLLAGGAADLLVFSFLWTILSVFGQTVLGLGTAMLLNQVGVKFKGFWRIIFILPWAIPEFIGALVWAQVFDPRFGWVSQAAKTWYETADYPGAVNVLTSWQENPNIALFVLLAAAIWFGFPFMMLAASAGLKMISDEIYDAAAIDGASGWRLFRFVTWPILLPLFIPAIIIRSIFAFNQFYLFYVLNPPYPLSTFATTSFFFFDQFGQYSVSAVINVFTLLVLVILLLLFNRWSKASEGVTYA